MKPFAQPTGVVDVQLEKLTNRLATPPVPTITSRPSSPAPSRAKPATSKAASPEYSPASSGRREALASGPSAQRQFSQPKPTLRPEQDPNNPDAAKKKKGLFGKIAGIFKDDKSSAPPAKPAENGQTPSTIRQKRVAINLRRRVKIVAE